MALYQVEISDDLARKWASKSGLLEPEIDKDLVESQLKSLVGIYGNWPAVVRDEHTAALAIVRQRAMEQAVATAQAGEDHWTITSRANGLLSYLTGR